MRWTSSTLTSATLGPQAPRQAEADPPGFPAALPAGAAGGGEIHFKTDNVGLFAFSVTEFPLGGFYPEQVTHDLHAQGHPGIMTDYEEKIP